ncbi:MAG: hypothetical protein JNJ58_07915 [Chitinophagaceae bacterium]|nr:hypothetical protein [Chitinophagaceae bacterium]
MTFIPTVVAKILTNGWGVVYDVRFYPNNTGSTEDIPTIGNDVTDYLIGVPTISTGYITYLKNDIQNQISNNNQTVFTLVFPKREYEIHKEIFFDLNTLTLPVGGITFNLIGYDQLPTTKITIIINANIPRTDLVCNYNPASDEFIKIGTSNTFPIDFPTIYWNTVGGENIAEVKQGFPPNSQDNWTYKKNPAFIWVNGEMPFTISPAVENTINIMGIKVKGNNPPYSSGNNPFFNDLQGFTGIQATNFKHFYIDNNIVQEVYGDGIEIQNGYYWSATDGTALNNSASEVNENIVLNSWGLNTYIDNYGQGISINGLKDVTCQLNYVENNIEATKFGVPPTGQFSEAGLTFQRDDNITIQHNYVSGYDRDIHIELAVGKHEIIGNRLVGTFMGMIFTTDHNLSIPTTCNYNFFSTLNAPSYNNQPGASPQPKTIYGLQSNPLVLFDQNTPSPNSTALNGSEFSHNTLQVECDDYSNWLISGIYNTNTFQALFGLNKITDFNFNCNRIITTGACSNNPCQVRTLRTLGLPSGNYFSSFNDNTISGDYFSFLEISGGANLVNTAGVACNDLHDINSTNTNFSIPNDLYIDNCSSTTVAISNCANNTLNQWFTNETCIGAQDGSIHDYFNGNVNFILNPGNVSSTSGYFTGLSSATYTVTSTDNNGVNTHTNTYTITAPTPVSITSVSSTNNGCAGVPTGSINASATGGTNPLLFTIMPGGVQNNNGIFSNLAANTYTITVSDYNNCSPASTIVTLGNSFTPITITTVITHASCPNANDGSILFTSPSGSGNTYTLLPSTTSSNPFISNLAPGTYSVTASNSSGCGGTVFSITEPHMAHSVLTQISCYGGNNGKVDIGIIGGSNVFTFNLMPGNVTNSTGVYDNLAANTYTVSASDGASCTFTYTFILSNPPQLTFSNPLMMYPCTSNLCNLSMQATGGTGSIQYTLLPGNVTNSSGFFTGLSVGTYTVIATDAKSCSLSSSITFSPAGISVQVTSSSMPSCNGGSNGSITVQATGGAMVYTYTLDNGSTLLTNSTGVFNSLPTGSYTITAIDQSNCTTNITTFLAEPPLLVLSSLTATNATCPGVSNGIINATANGGTGTILFNIPGITNPSSNNQISNLVPGTYTVKAADANGCTVTSTISILAPLPPILNVSTNNASCNGATGQIIFTTTSTAASVSVKVNGLTVTSPYSVSVGTYTVTATDNCNQSSSTTITISQPQTLTLAMQNGNLRTCATDLVVATGGTIPYNFTIAGPAGNLSVINALGAISNMDLVGIYTITVTDDNGCSATVSVERVHNDFCCNAALVKDNNVNLINNNAISSVEPLSLATTHYINGLYTIDNNQIASNITLRFTPNAKIEVNSGQLLSLTTCTLSAACSDMWDGIYASGAGAEVELEDCTIKDMENGIVVSAQAKLNANDSYFYDNLNGIQLKNLPSTYTGIVEQCTFAKQTGLINPWTSLVLGAHGIILENCQSVSIGNSSSATSGNTFSNIQNGIYVKGTAAAGSTPSIVSLYYNKFDHIEGGYHLWDQPSATWNIFNTSKGCAIYGDNINRLYNMMVVLDGNTSNSNLINFNHCNKAVILNAISGYVYRNHSENTDAGILFNQCDGKNFIAKDNILDGVMVGISKSGNESGGAFSNGFQAIGNTITLNTFPSTEYVFGYSGGIRSSYYNKNSTGITEANANTIHIPNTDYAQGISLYGGKDDAMKYNSINFSNTQNIPSQTVVPNMHGIYLSYNNNTFLYSNTIAGQNNSTALNNRRITGIYMHRNDRSEINCNDVNFTQFGIYTVGNNDMGYYDRLQNNEFISNSACLLFRHLSVEGTLGDIGSDDPNFSIYDCNNQFNGAHGLGRVHRISLCSSALPDKIVTQNSNLDPAESTSNTSGCWYAVSNPSTFNDVADCSQSSTSTSTDRARRIAQDSIAYIEYEEGGRWFDNMMLYKWLSRDSTIRLNDTILNNYYYEHHQGVLEQIYQADRAIGLLSDSSLMADNTAWNMALADARDVNAAIDDSCLFAANEKWMNSEYLDYLEFGLGILNEERIEGVHDLASSCPYIDGDAVYKARDLYAMFLPSTYYDDLEICNTIGLYKGGNSRYFEENQLLLGSNQINKRRGFNLEKIKVFPNPADDIVTIEYHLNENETGVFQLFSVLGNNAKSINLNHRINKVTFSVSDLIPGIYTYKYLVNNINTNTGKLIIE